MTSVLIVRKNGKVFDLEKLGFRIKALTIPSASYEHSTTDFGVYGRKFTGTTIKEKLITIELRVFSSQKFNVILDRNEIFRIFQSDESFYLIDMRLPTVRYEVRADNFTPEMLNHAKVVDYSINLTNAAGYGESTATTLTPFTFDSESWSIGMNLLHGVDLAYTHRTKNFKIYNASNIPILAEERPYFIKLKGGEGYNVSIINHTTGQEFILEGQLVKTDQLELKGVFPTLNGELVYYRTNHGQIDLAIGMNEIELKGINGDFEISFDTRFYY